jgi:mycoredoxin-dependent peroxiredoxin
MSVNVGDVAPDFELRDQAREPMTLSSIRSAKNTVIVFYPGAFTRTCSVELCALRDDLSEFQNDSNQLLAISVDSTPVHRAWASQEGFTYPLLSDFWPHGDVARRYGVFDEETGQAQRATFIVDREGIVRWKVVSGRSDPRNPGDYQRILASLA